MRHRRTDDGLPLDYTPCNHWSSRHCAALTLIRRKLRQTAGLTMRLVAFQPDIAANLGAMIRISACFGVAIDVIEPCGFPLSARDLRRAAMDYGSAQDVHRHDSFEAWQAAQPSGARLILLTTAGAAPLHGFRFHEEDRLMVGRESAGVPQSVASCADARVRIAMPGQGRSLNVSVAAGIALHEAHRSIGAL